MLLNDGYETIRKEMSLCAILFIGWNVLPRPVKHKNHDATVRLKLRDDVPRSWDLAYSNSEVFGRLEWSCC